MFHFFLTLARIGGRINAVITGILLLASIIRAMQEMMEQRRPSAHSNSISEEEARRILGVSVFADEEEIKLAYRMLMQRNHPDTGGSAELAAKINQARDVLLKKAI